MKRSFIVSIVTVHIVAHSFNHGATALFIKN